jgi:hypothetical protein
LLVLGFNYSSQCVGQPNCTTDDREGVGSYDRGSGAVIEVKTGYKLIVGSQATAGDTLSWDSADYPCNRTVPGPDCTPYCLYNVLEDEQERRELSTAAEAAGPRGSAHVIEKVLERLTKAYWAIGEEDGMPNIIDELWNEQGTPYDPRACEAASASGGYWTPWITDDDDEEAQSRRNGHINDDMAAWGYT